ncbi:LamG-like jellyroll fold domain-containing protein, partial [Fulvivirga kasyanovii]
INAGESIAFKDESIGNPTIWEWSFEGGTPTTSSTQHPNVTYSTPGVYQVTLKIANNVEPDGVTISKEVVVLPSDGLIAYYPFDENVNDQSGNQFNGTLNGASAFADRHQIADHAYHFDGVDDYVVTSSSIDDNLKDGASFSAWIYLADSGATGRIISNYNGTGTPGNCMGRIGFVFGVTKEQQLNIFYAIDGDDYDGRKTSSESLEVNKWYHVAGTWNGTFSPAGFKLYIDGLRRDVLDEEKGDFTCGTFQESDNPFHFGMGHCSIGECAPFNGGIDEIRIYDRPLTEEEILLLTKE